MTADSKQGAREGESVLSRWSRRKFEAGQPQADPGQKPTEEMPAETPVSSAEAGESSAEAEKPVLTDADMPDVDSLDENSDYSQFMSSGVSDKLRNLALRKLFHTPSFNIRDGLDEYDDDFTSFEKLGDIVTSDMKHRIEMEQQKLREKLAEEQAADDAAETENAELDAAQSAADQAQAEQQAAETGDEQLASLDDSDNSDDSGDPAKDEQRHGE